MDNELSNKKYEESLKVIYDKSISNYLSYLLDLRKKIIFSNKESDANKLRIDYDKLVSDFRDDLEGLEDLKDQVLTLNITKRINSNYGFIKDKLLKEKEEGLSINSKAKGTNTITVSENGLKAISKTEVEVSTIDLDKEYEIGNYDICTKEKDFKEINDLLINVFNRSPMAEKRKISKEPVTINAIENPEANRLDELNTNVRENLVRVSYTELLAANKKVYCNSNLKTLSVKQNNIKLISNVNNLDNSIKLISEILKDTETMDEKLKENVEKLNKTLNLEVEKEILRRLTIDLIAKENIVIPEVVEEKEEVVEEVVTPQKISFFDKLFHKKKS